MNRTLVIGGLVALAVLLGLASWLLLGSRSGTSPTASDTPAIPEGPIALNPVTVITKTGTTEAPDGRTLNILFSDFELRGAGKDVKTAVFSTTWHVKLQPGERVAVASAEVKGFMSSSAAQAPAAPAQPTTPPTDAVASTTAPATPPAEGTTQPVATQPAPAAPPKPVAGNGVATVVVSFGDTKTSVAWKDTTGEGANRTQAQAAVFNDPAHELRNGGSIPVTVTVELDAAGSAESVVQIDAVDLRLFVDNVPETTPVAPAAPAPAPAETPAPATP